MATRSRETIPGEVVDGLTADTALPIGAAQHYARTTAEPPEPETEGSIADRLRELIAGDTAGQVKIKLYRINPRSGAFEWCRDMAAAELQSGDLEPIREEWGAGSYELRVYGRQGLLAKPRVVIAEAMQPRQVQQIAHTSGNDGAVAQALVMIADTQRMILERLSAPPPPAPDPMAQMVQLGTVIATMRQAFGPAETATAGKTPFDQVKELLQVTREVKSAARELSDDTPAAEPESMLGLAGKALDAIRVLAPGQAAQLQHNPMPPVQPLQPLHVPASIPPAQQLQAQPAPDPTHNPDPAHVMNNTPETIEQIQMRQAIELLCALAAAGRPAVEGGAVIYERLPDELIDHLDHPEWFKLVSGAFPALAPHEAWMREAKAEADKLFAEDDDDNSDDTAATPAPKG